MEAAFFLLIPLSDVTARQGEELPVPWLLAQLGKENDCLFTIEATWSGNESMNVMEAQLTKRSSKSSGLREELEHLRQTIPNFSYEIDRANPSVVHVMDARLYKQSRYALDRVISSIDFEGKAQDLVIELGKLGAVVAPPTALFTDEALWVDMNQPVSIKGERLKVRDILTNSIQTRGRTNKILWIARTKLFAGDATIIYFQGSGKERI
jgi:hypothetical protein